MISAFQDEDWKELCAITGMNDLYDKYKSLNERAEGEAQIEIYAALERWAEDKSRSEVVKICQDAGLLAEPVMNDREVYECEHYRERGTVLITSRSTMNCSATRRKPSKSGMKRPGYKRRYEPCVI